MMTWTKPQLRYLTEVLGLRQFLRPAAEPLQFGVVTEGRALVLTHWLESSDSQELIGKMLAAIGIKEIGSFTVGQTRLSLRESKCQVLLAFGLADAKHLGLGASVKFGEISRLEGKLLLLTHDLKDLLIGDEAEVQRFKRESWEHLKTLKARM